MASVSFPSHYRYSIYRDLRRNKQSVHLPAERLSHLAASNIGNGMQSETVEELVVVKEVLPNAVDHKMEQLVLLMEEQRHGQIANLLLRVFIRRDQVHSLEVPKIDIPAQDVDVKQLADIFLLVVAAEVAILELLSDVGQLLVDSLLFQFAGTSVSQIGDELYQASHISIAAAGAANPARRRRRHVGGLIPRVSLKLGARSPFLPDFSYCISISSV